MNIARKIIKDQSKKLEDYLLGQWVTLENAHLFEIEYMPSKITTVDFTITITTNFKIKRK